MLGRFRERRFWRCFSRDNAGLDCTVVNVALEVIEDVSSEGGEVSGEMVEIIDREPAEVAAEIWFIDTGSTFDMA